MGGKIPMFSGNKVLFIAPKFYEYENIIINELRKKGLSVTLVTDSMKNENLLCRIVWQAEDSSLKKKILLDYYKKHVTCDNDYVLTIRGANLSKELIHLLRERNPSAKFILYQWDCVELNKHALEIAEYFDEVSTFDINDSKKFGWKYVPMFHLDSQIHGEKKEYLTFIGSMHTKRAVIAREMHKLCQDNDYKCFVFLYNSFLFFIKQKFILKNDVYKSINLCDLHFRPLPLKKVLKIYSKTKVMFDYTTPCQSGFSTRIMESLSYKYKLVTN